MESPPYPLVSYNSPACSPRIVDQFSRSISPHSSSDAGKKCSKLPPTTDDVQSDGNEDAGSQRQSLESLVNPPLPSELGEAECALLRGDAIGNTAYTNRWILNTLLTITQALPKYLANTKPTEETTNNDVRMENGEQEVSGEQKGDSILELAEDVENAACQLWDMTAEPDVVHHLLNLDVVDILQLAKDIITLSRAPRLTEVVVGVVANLCCQSEGCVRVIGHQSLLNSCLTLLHVTDDVPTLVEAFRLLRLLLWHLTYRVAPQDRSRCPLILTLKSHENLKEEIVFMLKNSLSELLLSALSEFLVIMMYVWLPGDHCYMASYYSESGLVEGVVELMRHFLKQWEKSGGQEMPKAVHQGVLILYSFVATPAVNIISSSDQYESLLEPILVTYVEHLAKVESIEELLEEENAERLTYALGLCELLVPTMRHSNILLPVVKLMALANGANYHYTAINSQTTQEAGKQGRAGEETSEPLWLSRSKQEVEMGNDVPVAMEKQREPEQEKGEDNVGNKKNNHREMTFRNLEFGIDNCKSTKNVTVNSEGTSTKNDVCKDKKDGSISCKGSDSFKFTNVLGNPISSPKLTNIIDSLIDYCVRVVRCCPDLWAVLTALNECHVHEVQLFFRAVRIRDPKLVGQLQEQLLDSGSYNRLVTILSDMYS